MSEKNPILEYLSVKLGDLGYTYPGLSGKSKDHFGFGKPYIPYMNIFSNSKIKKEFLEYVDIKPNEKQNKVQLGDLFFTTSSETVEEVGMTSVLLNEIGEAYLNSFCFGFRLHNFEILLPEYAAYLFRGEELRKKISLFGQGSTRYNLPKTQMLSKLYLNVPNKNYQKKIAHILTTCDKVIEQTQFAIAKYKAIKQGMLHDLFTRGLDANGKLRPKYEDAPELYKESKLGWVLKNWEVDVFSNKVQIISGGTPPTHNREYWNGTIPWLSVDDFNNGERYVKCATKHITEEGLKNSATNFLKKGMIIISARGTVGVISQLGIEMTFNQSCYGLNSNDTNIHNDYIYYFLIHYKTNSGFISFGSVFSTITKDYFDSLDFYFPKDTNEAKEIVQRISLIDSHIETEENYLFKLQQIKTGLMGDLLNGEGIPDIKCN